MTAETIITNVAGSALTGTKIGDITVAANKTKLLASLNQGIKQIAQDTLLWIDGEIIAMVADTYEYTLNTIPVQMIDVYDDSLTVRPRNSPSFYGYYQTAPDTIKMNNITAGDNININYYIFPDDYILTDEVIIPPSLVNSLSYFIASKAMEYYKSDQDVSISKGFMLEYLSSIQAFKANTDANDVDTLVDTDMIFYKNLV